MGRPINKLNEFHKRFCAEYVSGEFAGNGTRSYLKVYPTKTPKYASIGAMAILKKPQVQAEILRLKEGAGLTDKFVYEKIHEGMNAKVTTAFRGRVIESDIPDYAARHKYLETAAKLLDMFPSQKIESRSMNIDIQIEKLPPAELAKLLTGMAKQINVNTKRKVSVLGNGENQDGA